ncbi:DUF4214 domain-containing protein [Vreelandella aquamarina]|uniref:DUF4214 domain-containing protein n=1 Tax=Vreelandella aquamarina TaxID=77097 RepID=UPI0007832423|nr:DUF4214 domain-containing protein [Halomonas axialensis]
MATQESLDLAQTLYVAYYGRPADRAGLNYWADEIDANGVDAMVNAFGNSAEFEARFGNLSNEQLINNLYQQMFGRSAELAGLDFYSAQLANGESTLAEIALDIANGAQNEDATALSNKVAVAANFTAAIDTTEEVLAYAGDSAANSARDFLATVNAETDAETVDVDAQLSSLVQADQDETTAGETFTLTAGPDSLTGTNLNDTFNALTVRADGTDATTLSAFDSIDGGAGEDTLNIYTDADAATPLNAGFLDSATVRNVEIVNIFNTNGAAAFGDASKYEGVEQLWQIGAAGAVTELGANTTAGFRNIATGTFSVTAANAAAAASVALDGIGEAATLNVLGTATGSLNSVTVSGTRLDSDNNGEVANLNLAVTAGQDQETVSVDTAFDTTLTVTDGAGKTVKTVDATASEAGITYTTAANTVSTIKTGAGNDTVTINTATSNATGAVVNALVETGEGNDQITVNTTGTGSTTVNAGAGDDTITLTSALTTSTRIDGGEGADKLVLPTGGVLVAGDYELIGSTVSNVESLEFGATVTADASKLSQFSELTFAATQVDLIDNVGAEQTLVAKGSLTAEAAGYVVAGANPATYAGTLNVTAQAAANPVAQAIDVSAAAANVTVSAASGNAAAPAASQDAANIATITGDVQTLNVVTANGVNNANLDASAAADTLSVVDITVGDELAELTELTLSGNGSVTVDNANGANANAATKLATINASELGGELAYGANAGNITGGLNYTGNIAVAESVTLGSGADIVNANSTYGLMDTIIGFDSTKETNDGTSVTDTLVFGGLDTSAGVATKVTLSENATSLGLAFVEAASASDAASDAVVTFQFGGNTYLFQDGADAGSLDDNDLAIEIVGLHDFSQDFDTFAA